MSLCGHNNVLSIKVRVSYFLTLRVSVKCRSSDDMGEEKALGEDK